jgi:hypothetical protein
VPLHADIQRARRASRFSAVCRFSAPVSALPGILSYLRLLTFLLALSALALLAFARSAPAATSSPGWMISSLAKPTSFTAADNARCAGTISEPAPLCDTYQATATNVGARPTNGSPVTLTIALPAQLEVRKISFFWSGSETDLGGEDCSVTSVRCRFPSAVAPDQTLQMVVYLTVPEAVSGPIASTASVSGGHAPEASTSGETPIGASSSPFGLASFSALIAGTDGTPEGRAAARPYELTADSGLVNGFREGPEGLLTDTTVEDVRDVAVDLPPGLIAGVRGTPTCTFAQLSSQGAAGQQGLSGCPVESAVGHIRTFPKGGVTVNSTVFNMVPERGVAAEFGYADPLGGSHVLYAGLVPTPAGYLTRITARELPQIALTDLIVNFYGDPATRDGTATEETVPTFTNPSDCDGVPLKTEIHIDSWQHPGTYNPDGSPNFSEPNWVTATSESPPVSGCNQLSFEPTITATPETNRADSPTGFEVDLKVPQGEGTETPGTPPLKTAVVTLPAGMSVNPSSANGMQGCSLAALGMSASGEPNAAPPRCPDPSKVGSVELRTPALPGVLQGQIYVAKQTENPFGSLLAIYLVVADPTTGVVVKLPGEVKVNPTNGQLETIVEDSPQFPFSELKADFFGGAKAALRTPATCGTYEVTSQLTPWSAPESGPPVTSTTPFRITQAADGGTCPTSAAARPGQPTFSAGSLASTAGAYSPFALRLSRADGSQELKGLNLILPTGLLGRLTGVAECSEADLALAKAREREGGGAQELAAPSCPASSEVGVAKAGADAGATPYYVTGHAYLAGPYKGAPLSLAIITPAVVGPFDLGDVVVRVALHVNPETAQVTADSDPVSTVVHGIPLDLRSIALSLNRPDFTLNPTSCERQAVSGEALSVLGQSAPLFNSFQVGGCSKLAFRPGLSLRFLGPTHRGSHPGLRTVLTAGGGEAGLARAAVTLPATELLDSAHIGSICTEARFAAGHCPRGSIYGHAKAWTPLLDRPLEGPVYLRSSRRRLPDLVASLSGQIHLDLTAHVDTVHGRLRDTFAALPDAPLSKLVLTMRGGSKGLLVNTSHFCARRPRAGASFLGHNGKWHYTEPAARADCAKGG